LQAIGGSLRCPAIDRLLTRSVRLQRLMHEHRQRRRGRVQPLAVSGSHASVVFSNSALVSTLKNSTASVDPERRLIRMRRCCKSLRALRSMRAGLRKDGLDAS